ncbi:MAG: M12 family metallo-peptidase, partial [FCB group bacterium]
VFTYCFGLVYAQGETQSTLNAKSFFSYPTEINYTNKSKSNSLQSVSSSNDVKCISFNNTSLNETLINSSANIKIQDFPITPSTTGTIVLQPQTPIIDANTEIWVNSKDGEYKCPPINIQSYYGTIEGQKNSKVFFTIAENMLYCIIQPESGEKYFISPVTQASPVPNAHLLVSESVLLSKNVSMPISCYTPENTVPGGEIIDRLKNKDQVLSNKLLQLNLAVEASSDYCAIFANDTVKILSQIISVMTCVSKIYETELNTVIYLPYIYLWKNTATDPYAGKTDIANKLYAMPKAWKSRSSVNRSLACLFAALPTSPGIFTAGISMGVGTLCNKNDGYCVFGMYGSNNLPTMNYTWDVNVTAHEVGHGCGSQHTHNCYWDPLIDTCVTQSAAGDNIADACTSGAPVPRPGTLMSYCHLTNSTHSVQYTFGDRVIKVIRATLESAPCITETPNPMISLLSPLVDKMYKSGIVVPITWTSTKVNFVTIKYSTNGGTIWNDIATALPASNLTYNWLLPNIQSDKVYILIRDTYNMTVADTSFKPLSIHSPSLQLTSVLDGKKYGQKEDINLAWSSVFSDTINIDISYDGGSNWTNLFQNITGNYYTISAPEVISSNCIVKIKNSANNNLNSVSGFFSIGKSIATITHPSGEEKLCIGDDYTIEWQSDFLNSVFLEYSIDNQSTWKKVNIGAADAKAGQYKWHIPDNRSNNVFIRIFPKADKTNILDVTKQPFSIDSCLTGINENNLNTSTEIKILNVVPNPLYNNAVIKIQSNISLNKEIELYIINTTGQLLQNIGNFDITGNSTFEINFKTSGLAQGSYFIILSSGETKMSYPIQIIR